MIIQPRTRGFICLTAHPEGCAKNVTDQIAYVTSKENIDGPKKVLIIGASTGFGLASRITAAFGSQAATIGVFLEKPPKENRPASPGWYNSAAFETEANKQNLYAKSINGDAFSTEVKEETIQLIKEDLGTVDLVIYSLASPVRKDPESGIKYKSVLKPIGKKFENKTVDFHTGELSNVAIDPANQEDIDNTIKVMGGEDWTLWIKALLEAGVLAENCTTVAYSYIGPEVTQPVYREGTIGMAKNDLEQTAFTLTDQLKDIKGKAYVSVNKALVTQASSAIPVIPLYISLLYQVMKDKNIHEGCIEQIYRLFSERLFTEDTIPLDTEGRIRIDDWEMRKDVQEEIQKLWSSATSDNIADISDLEGYRKDFFNLFGFKVPGIDESKEVDEMLWITSIAQNA
ncbi:trans-2-enoyl-CoA reductase family protein [Aquimarina sp. ERC-38]|uniref:enoyl-ACP reductase FabV n=1 Tax=Aquimarina sp. ERC-38 TaxID=2949996 RepID=UPI002246FA5B|nr:enoyl-ACP reductase FabV [Aquimarina sp. ERC-38]UZO80357.1 trans-2-enoyl-CoA reductase family protein [Aquimarina sp. ERC-38]